MRTIVLVTQKGGAGKTSIGASLAVAAAQAGEKVVVLDLDPQGSLAAWGETREAETPAVDRIGADQLATLPAILDALKGQGFTLAVLDTAGVASTSGNLAMQAATLALVPSAVHRVVKAAATRAGLSADVSAHWLRHAHASHALDRGAPIHLVQATLGHASVATTGRYLHARPSESSARFLGV